jgi:YbbR domain-containing protein
MPERFASHWPLKLLALVLALGIWIAVTGEGRTLKDFTVPVSVQLDEASVFAAPPPTAVTVRLAGTESAIRRLDPLDLTVRLDVEAATPGERDVQLSETHLSGVPAGIEVLLFSPERVSLAIDRRMRRELPVSPDLVGAPPEGAFLYGLQVRPETLVVEGPESIVGAMTSLRTDPIPLDGRTRSFVANVAAVPEQSLVRVLDPRPIEVRGVIDVPPVEITFGNVPVSVSGEGFAATIQPASLRVTLSGPALVLGRMTKAQIRAVADASGLQPEDGPRRVSIEASVVDLPQEQLSRIRVKSIDPAEVSIRLAARSGDKS